MTGRYSTRFGFEYTPIFKVGPRIMKLMTRDSKPPIKPIIIHGTRFDNPVSHLDIFSTAAAISGAEIPDDRKIDGVDLMPFIRGEKTGDPHESIFWRQGYYRGILNGGWKMTVSKRPEKVWLFNLRKDPTEQNNIAAKHPEKVAELQALLQAHNAEQVEPLWDTVVEGPIRIDKTSADPWEEGDALVYWPN